MFALILFILYILVKRIRHKLINLIIIKKIKKEAGHFLLSKKFPKLFFISVYSILFNKIL